MKPTLIFLPLLLFSLTSTQAFNYKICADQRHKNICEQLERSEKIKCEIVENDATCLTKIQSGEVDFGSVSAETAFLGSRLVSNVSYVGATYPESRDDAYDYATVVVSTRPIETFSDLKGTSYCHPGFDDTSIPPLLLKEFEMNVLKEVPDRCENDLETVTEKYLSALNIFFGESCRPGRWSQDDAFDKELQDKYRNLIDLCPKINLLSDNPLERATHCISRVDNSVALTTLSTVNKLINGSRDINYVCKNGTSSKEPCVWAKQPHRIIVRNMQKKEAQSQLFREIKEWLSEHVYNHEDNNGSKVNLDADDIVKLSEILGLKDGNIQENVNFSKTDSMELMEFAKGLRDLPTPDDSRVCDHAVMKWCTTSEKEQSKCEWLSQAAVNYGIQPVLQCVKKPSEIDCIEAIKMGDADLRTIPASYGYFSKRKGLATIAFPETTSGSQIKTLLIVKGDNITRLENLKGKKGCFPIYGGVAWVSFLSTVRGIIVPEDTCAYGKSLSDVLGDSCMPGAYEHSKAIQNNEYSDQMCKLCTDSGKTCEPNEGTNWYFGNSGALRCFENDGNFAVIVSNESLAFPNGGRVMCRNGTISNLDAFSVDEDCYLSVLTTSEVVTRRNDPKNKDIRLALLEYDRWFAAVTHPAFYLFNSFDGEKDLLFKDSTPGLDLPTSDKKLIKNYVNTFKHIDTCTGGGTSNSNGNNKANIAFLSMSMLILQFIVLYII